MPLNLTKILYKVGAKVLKKCNKCDWMAFKSPLLSFYQTDSNAVVNIVFASFFQFKGSKPITILATKHDENIYRKAK